LVARAEVAETPAISGAVSAATAATASHTAGASTTAAMASVENQPTPGPDGIETIVEPVIPTTRKARRAAQTGSIPVIRPGQGQPQTLTVSGLPAHAIGQIAMVNGVHLHELRPLASTLEDAYMELTKDAIEYHTGAPDQFAGDSSAPLIQKRGKKK